MGIHHFPRLHFSGTCRAHVPTGNNNNVGIFDVGTLAVYKDNEVVTPDTNPQKYHEWMREQGLRYNASGAEDPAGDRSKCAGWDQDGNNHFSWNSRVTGVEMEASLDESAPVGLTTNDPIVGRSVELWGHYNEYLGTTANVARMVDSDPSSNWTTSIFSGMFAVGRAPGKFPGSSTYMMTAKDPTIAHAKKLKFSHILQMPSSVLTAEYVGCGEFQFAVPKEEFWFGQDANQSDLIMRWREELRMPVVRGLIVRYFMYNMATVRAPNSAAHLDLHGTVSLWYAGELSSVSMGRYLIPPFKGEEPPPADDSEKLTPVGPLAVHIHTPCANSGGRVWVTLDMISTIPHANRADNPGPGPTHPPGPKADLGELLLVWTRDAASKKSGEDPSRSRVTSDKDKRTDPKRDEKKKKEKEKEKDKEKVKEKEKEKDKEKDKEPRSPELTSMSSTREKANGTARGTEEPGSHVRSSSKPVSVDGIIIARVPYSVYAFETYKQRCGLVDMLLDDDYSLEELDAGVLSLHIVKNGRARRVLGEVETRLLTDDGNVWLEFPDPSEPRVYDRLINFWTLHRGKPRNMGPVYVHQFPNIRNFPQLKMAWDAHNPGQEFVCPMREEMTIVHFADPTAATLEWKQTIGIQPTASGHGRVLLSGQQGGCCRLLLSLSPELEAPLDASKPADFNYDNNDMLGFWGNAHTFNVRVLPDDWHYDDVPMSKVDYDYIYEHVLCYYELIYTFMSKFVFSFADRGRTLTYAKLIYQMCDMENFGKTYYMPPTRELSGPKARLLYKFLNNTALQTQPSMATIASTVSQRHRDLDNIYTREQLQASLRTAIEVELSLMIQYIYAAYSLPCYSIGKQYVLEGRWTEQQLRMVCGENEGCRFGGWRNTLLDIAHQEMIHFLIANNILIAVGGGFHTTIPNYPTDGHFSPANLQWSLDPFNMATLMRFIMFETPHYYQVDFRPRKSLQRTDTGLLRADAVDACTVGELYLRIKKALTKIPNVIVKPVEIPLGDHHLFFNEKFNQENPDYQCIISDAHSAAFAVDAIMEQGEGASPDSPDFVHSHFERFRRVAYELGQQQNLEHDKDVASPIWNPSYPVISNPKLALEMGHRGTKVTNATTRKVMALTNVAYESMCLMMKQHFGSVPVSARKSPLMNLSIDLMTGIIRPLGILLMTLPSGFRTYSAGPSFEIDVRSISYMPIPYVAMQIFADKFYGLHTFSCKLSVVSVAVRDLLLTFAKQFDVMAASFLSVDQRIQRLVFENPVIIPEVPGAVPLITEGDKLVKVEDELRDQDADGFEDGLSPVTSSDSESEVVLPKAALSDDRRKKGGSSKSAKRKFVAFRSLLESHRDRDREKKRDDDELRARTKNLAASADGRARAASPGKVRSDGFGTAPAASGSILNQPSARAKHASFTPESDDD